MTKNSIRWELTRHGEFEEQLRYTHAVQTIFVICRGFQEVCSRNTAGPIEIELKF